MNTVWMTIRREAEDAAEREPLLRKWLADSISGRASLEEALAWVLAPRLAHTVLAAEEVNDIVLEACAEDDIRAAIHADLAAVVERDPASDQYLLPLLYLKGFHALEAYRVSNWLWRNDREHLARFFQSRISEVFGVDIHPAATIGKGILVDHATGVVIGETAIVEDNVSLLHEVTLGGTGKESGARHPIIRSGVLIGAGAKVLGRVEVGRCAKIGAGSVVLMNVPAHSTVAGVPGRIVGAAAAAEPARDMDHNIPGCDESRSLARSAK